MPRNTLGAVRCKAHSSRTGKPCQQWAIHGATVCVTHGGSAPQVKFSASERIQALVPLALTKIEKLIELADTDTVSLTAARDILDRAGHKAAEKIDLNARFNFGQMDDDALEKHIAGLQSSIRRMGRGARGTTPAEVPD